MKSLGGINSYFGGIGEVMSSKSDLAFALGIPDNAISKFKIVGFEIQCRISINYATRTNAFNYTEGRYLTSFYDYEGKCTNFGNNTFKTVSQPITEVYAPGIITQTGTSLFQDAAGATLLDMPNCTSVPSGMFGNWNGLGKVIRFDSVVNYGNTQGDNNVFVGNNTNATVYANTYNQTSNGGGVEGDLQKVIDDPQGNVIWI